MPKVQDELASHIAAIQEGYQRRAEANIQIGQALSKLTVTRMKGAKKPDEISAALQNFADQMAHW